MLGTAYHLAAAAHDRDRVGCRWLWIEQSLLSDSASLREHSILGRIQFSGARQARFDELGQGQIHVIAAQQEVVANRIADKAELALLFDSPDQTEVGRAAPHVHDQTTSAGLQVGGWGGRGSRRRLRSRLGGSLARPSCLPEPAIERGLRLFEERELFQAGLTRCLDRKVARHLIE